MINIDKTNQDKLVEYFNKDALRISKEFLNCTRFIKKPR